MISRSVDVEHNTDANVVRPLPLSCRAQRDAARVDHSMGDPSADVDKRIRWAGNSLKR